MIPFSNPIEHEYVAIGLAAFALGLLLWVGLRRGRVLGRVSAWVIGIAWTAFGTAEYWIFGAHSALGRPDEYNATIPWIYYLTHVHRVGLYAHEYSGGVDAVVGVGFGTQFISLERIVFGSLPLWLAILFMNVGAIGIGYAGGYRLGRTGLRLPRGQAIVVGLLASGTHIYNLAWATGGIGWAIALMPWGVYFLCLRAGRPRYYPYSLAFAVLYSASTSIVHSVPAFYVGLMVASLLLRPLRGWQFLRGCALFGVVCLLNWADALYALLQLAPDMARANAVEHVLSMGDHLRANADVVLLPVGIVALAIFLIRRDRSGLAAVLGMALAFASGHLVGSIGWRPAGIKLLSAYRWDLISDGYFVVALIVAGRALLASDWVLGWGRGQFRLSSLIGAYFAAIAVVAVADHKAINMLNYENYGGSAIFSDAPILSRLGRESSGRLRVVTNYGLFASNTANAYGLDTFDGFVQAFSIRQNLYYGWAVLRPPNPAPHTHIHFIDLPKGESAMGSAVNLDALRIANVGYVLSERRLSDADLAPVDDSSPQIEGGVESPLMRHLHHWISPEATRSVYVYAVHNPWPRVFVPAVTRVSHALVRESDFYRELLTDAVRPTALIAHDDSAALAGRLPSATAASIMSFRLVANGFDIDLGPGADPGAGPGIVVVNAPYSKFWMASSAGRPQTVIPVNGIQMAIIVTQPIGRIELRYQRPTLATLFATLTHPGAGNSPKNSEAWRN